MKKNLWYLVSLLFVFSFTLFQCKCGKNKTAIPNVDNSKVNLTFYRFDKEFFVADTNQTKSVMPALKNKYGSFYNVYVYDLMRFGSPKDYSDNIYYSMNAFFTFKDMRMLYQLTEKNFTSTDENNEEIKKAYAYSAHYIPNLKLPNKLVYCMSGLNAGAFTVDTDYVGVGLDMYLHDDTLYNQIFPNYIASKLRKEMICQNVMKAIYNNQYNDPYLTEGALINCMIQVGKQQYYLEKVLPHIEEEYRFGYSEAQLKWCNDNEKEIWKFLADKDLFYTESDEEIRHFIGEQANTQGMPIESPGNIGAWIGYQIVSAYMDEMNNTVSLQTLIDTDPKTILAKSKYKP